MASVGKCLGIMTGAGFLATSAIAYGMNTKINKHLVTGATKYAKDGKIPIGGQDKDGKLWDGFITVDEYKKNLSKKAVISSLISGVTAAVGTAIISGLTLLLRGKIK